MCVWSVYVHCVIVMCGTYVCVVCGTYMCVVLGCVNRCDLSCTFEDEVTKRRGLGM